MEAVEELSMHIPGFEGTKDNIPAPNAAELSKDCHKTNGVTELPSVEVDHVAASDSTEPSQSAHQGVAALGVGLDNFEDELNLISAEQVVTTKVTADSSVDEPTTADSGIGGVNESVDVDSSNMSEFVVDTSVSAVESTVIETEVDGSMVLDSSGENVKFETEVLVEQEETVISTTNDCNETLSFDNESDNKILSELDGHSLDLSEALGTPDVHDGSENNNSSLRQEVFNKEELLDILEGNEPEKSDVKRSRDVERALQQLTKLKRKKVTGKAVAVSRNQKKKETMSKVVKQTVSEKQPEKSKSKDENIVKALVEDWEDEEPEDDNSKKLLQDSEQLVQASEEFVEQQQDLTQEDNKPPVDSILSDDQSLNKSSEEGPQRRLGRVIKKKVIFDPDNPDTFTKGKTIKNKEPQSDKETPPIKKLKPEQSALRATSKSPVNKTQWKKPTPKKSAQHKRLTEVDKLLMDEGAVNMMYQLTPEAPKGRKNMRTKAEFIKKINQSSTPDAKEMKFRERKKEMPKEEAEAKKCLKTSLSGSVKSVSVGEEFENTSADDSIIYRRHSSSSYSSTCMSPRRLSDVEAGAAQTVAQALQQTAESISAMDCEPTENGQLDSKAIFMASVSDNPTTDTIKKKDCLTLKEKLNTKLSNALNKRKREMKTDKPIKQKKLTPKLDKSKELKETPVVYNFKILAMSYNGQVAEICIEKSKSSNNLCGLEAILELKQALDLINNRKETSITLLSSETLSLCSKLNLTPLLETNMERKISHALEFTSAIRSLLSCLDEHRKVLVCGVEGACEGLALGVLALCDVAAASESASFALAASRDAPPVPGLVALTSPSSRLSRSLVNELVICARRLSSREALERGLVTLTLWPAGFGDQLRAWVGDMAAQPLQSLLLKKKLLSVNGAGSKSTFQAMLASEQDQLTAYWSSVEGQESLQAHLNAP